MIKKVLKIVKENVFLVGLFLFSVLIFFVNIRINIFHYDNFDFGKFDLGNMTQMLWNTLHGRILYLTDYFGSNVSRWSMSHVDPILLLFVPIFALYQHPLTLVVSQLILIIFSSLLIYKITYLELKSKFAASILGASFLVYPAVGFITALTTFHGVSVVIPFFLGAFYLFETMHKSKKFTIKRIILFWVLLVLTMMGKEEIPLYIVLYGVFIFLFRAIDYKKIKFNPTLVKIALSMILVGLAWFYVAFFVIIPHYAKYRTESYRKFVESLDIQASESRDVDLPNYFLSRYDVFGDSYTEVAVNMIFNPELAVKVFFGGDRIQNLIETFAPLLYIPLAFPPILAISLPDFLINYLTSAGGIGTAEIYNHRISMIIPILFLAVIYAISFYYDLLQKILQKIKINKKVFSSTIALLILSSSIYTSFLYQNPVYMWLSQSVKKRLIGSIVYAKTDIGIATRDIKVGEIFKLSELDNKDRECAGKIIKMIPKDASVSGPDYLGAHLSMRETYAIFPALYNEADYVVVDVFSKKILTILNVNTDLIRNVTEKIMKDPNYTLTTGCGNLFVFKRIGPHNKNALLPLQERFEYSEKNKMLLFLHLFIADYEIPKEIKRGEPKEAKIVYVKEAGDALTNYVMFMSFVNTKTGEMYQMANLPSFAVKQPGEWEVGKYYIENLSLALPEFLDAGTYRVFLGMGNSIRTRSMYLGEMQVL